MPAGVSLYTYAKFAAAAGFSMFLGSHTVHTFYRPLDDLDLWYRRAQEEENTRRIVMEARGQGKVVKLADKQG